MSSARSRPRRFASPPGHDRLRRLVERFPRPLRFLGVGGFGLITDLGTFSIVLALGLHPLAARVVSLAIATFVTWRLNRALTFDQSGRRFLHWFISDPDPLPDRRHRRVCRAAV